MLVITPGMGLDLNGDVEHMKGESLKREVTTGDERIRRSGFSLPLFQVHECQPGKEVTRV